jgi:hypothetical protein
MARSENELELSTQQSLSLLRDSLGEAQATVRAYDTKAQIVGIGYIFALGIVTRVGEALPKTSEINIVYVLVAWGVVILPILLFGFVLYPSRKKAPRLANELTMKLEHILYIDPQRLGDLKELKEAAGRCDPISEIAFELLKVSMLRELKRRRFLRALFAAGICFAVLFASQLTQSF